MTDYIKREDAIEAVVEKLQNWGSYAFEDYRRGLYEAKDIIEALPSADAVSREMREPTEEERASVKRYIDSISADVVSVVRCKDCRHGHRVTPTENGNDIMCDYSDWEYTDNDFCSRGELADSTDRNIESRPSVVKCRNCKHNTDCSQNIALANGYEYIQVSYCSYGERDEQTDKGGDNNE